MEHSIDLSGSHSMQLSTAMVCPVFDAAFDRTFGGPFDGAFDRTFGGTFDGTFDGTFRRNLVAEAVMP